MKIRIDQLKENSYSKMIYDHTPSYDLIDSISKYGVKERILITKDNKIMSGHRRVNACKQLGIEEIEVEYTEDNDFNVIEFNRYRQKIWNERFNEIEELDKDWKRQAKEQQGTRTDILPNLAESSIDTREKISSYLGIAHGTYYMAKYIRDRLPQAFEKIDKGESSIHREYLNIKRDEQIDLIKQRSKEPNKLEGKFRIIYADPPWKYNNTMPEYFYDQSDHYQLMSIKELMNLPVNDISEENSVLFLWVTSPILEDSFKIINAWGFKYKASFVWDKVKHNMGHYNSVRHEFLLICVKGSCQPDIRKLFDSVIVEERTKHSKKPEQFRKIIDTIYPYGQRIELFAREKKYNNWEVFGNELY